MKTRGKYAIEQHGFAVKPNKDNGDVIDWKCVMKKDAREETRFDLDHMAILTGASKTNGLNIEVTPMSLGQALPPLLIPVNLMGTVKVTDEGAVSLTLRMMRNAMNAQGAGFDMISEATLCLDCVVGEMESLEEQAAKAGEGDVKVDAPPLLTADEKTGNTGEQMTPVEGDTLTSGDAPEQPQKGKTGRKSKKDEGGASATA